MSTHQDPSLRGVDKKGALYGACLDEGPVVHGVVVPKELVVLLEDKQCLVHSPPFPRSPPFTQF